MKKLWIIGFIIILLTSRGFAQVGFEGRPIINNLMMPTGYTLNQGEFIVGIGSIGFGISDNVQVGTNILLFIFQVYNANIKVSFLKTESDAFSIGLAFGRINLDVVDVETDYTYISPYAVYSTKVGTKTMLHFGGQYRYFSGDEEIEEAKAESGVSGTSIYAGIENSFSNKTKFLFEGGYDVTFEGFRFGGGVLFGWEKFRLKLGVSYFNFKDIDAFTFPNIGLWWRFQG